MNFPILSSITLLPILGAIFIFIFNNKNNENKNVIYISLFISAASMMQVSDISHDALDSNLRELHK